MALIKCPECGNNISDSSITCICCGFLVKKHFEKKQQEEKIKKEKETKKELEKQQKIEAEEKISALVDKRNISINHKGKIIELNNGILTISLPLSQTISDYIFNFKLEYFAVSMKMNVGLCITNVTKAYSSGVIDITCFGSTQKDFKLFKEIMDNNGLFSKRSRFNVIYKKTEDDKKIQEQKQKEYEHIMGYDKEDGFTGIYKYTMPGKKERVRCPRCKSTNCSHYQEQQWQAGITKTRYTKNINPFRPFTVLNKKDKVIRQDKLITQSKILCNDCGFIFK